MRWTRRGHGRRAIASHDASTQAAIASRTAASSGLRILCLRVGDEPYSGAMRDREEQRLPPDRLDAFTERTLRTVRRLPPWQRDIVVTRILEADPDLATVLPALRSTIATAHRIRLPLRRDGVA
jgi:hypothetical protein